MIRVAKSTLVTEVGQGNRVNPALAQYWPPLTLHLGNAWVRGVNSIMASRAAYRKCGLGANWDFRKCREGGMYCRHTASWGGSEGSLPEEIFEILTIWDQFWYIFRKGPFYWTCTVTLFGCFWCVQVHIQLGGLGYSPPGDFWNSSNLRSCLVHFETKRLLSKVLAVWSFLHVFEVYSTWICVVSSLCYINFPKV